MTGEEAARALEALAVVFRIRSYVSAHEVVDALSTAMGVVRVDGPMTNAEKCRQYRHRKRHRSDTLTVSNGVGLVSESVAHPETPDLTYQVESVSDSSKTPSSSQPDLFRQGDTGTDTGATPTTPKRKRRWRRVPDDFAPTDEHRRIATEMRVDFDLELAKYRDHEFKDPKTDANATFKNWLRNAKPTARNGNGSAQSPAAMLAERARRIAAGEKA